MIIRPAKIEDIEQGLELIKEFHTESLDEYNIFCDENIAREVMKAFISTSLVMEKDGKIIGVISGAITNYPLNNKKIFQEVLWFVSKQYRKYGLLLLKELERYAKEIWGCAQIVMVHMMDTKAKKLSKFYVRQGFKPLEMQYIKTL